MRYIFATMICICGYWIVTEAAPVKVEPIKYSIYAPQTIETYRAICIQNDKNRYVIKFVETKPRDNQPGSFQIRLREPTSFYSFSRPINDFLNIKVGNLSLQKLSPNLDAISFWNREKVSGFTLPLNFSGKKCFLSFCMKEDSSILWCSFVTPENNIEPVDLSIKAVPSALNVGQWIGYSRYAKTAQRQIQGSKKYPLNTQDRYMILADNQLNVDNDKSNKSKAVGPCLIVWQSENTSASIENLDRYIVTARFRSQKNIVFGIFESKRKYTNAEFDEYFKTLDITVPNGLN